MMSVSLAWLVLHTTALISLMVWFALPTSLHPTHWTNTSKMTLLHPVGLGHVLYPVCIGLIVLGPLSILTLMLLRSQVKAMEKGQKKELVKQLEKVEKNIAKMEKMKEELTKEQREGCRLLWAAAKDKRRPPMVVDTEMQPLTAEQ